jgi:hypothetical protein
MWESDQGFEDCLEGVCDLEPCCVDGYAHIRLGLGGPHSTVAVYDFSLDHAGPQLLLQSVVYRRILEALHFFTVENVRWRALPERFTVALLHGDWSA